MRPSDNKRHISELKSLRDKLNKADRVKDYPTVVDACLAIIELGTRDKGLNVMVCLYHKDLGEAYLKLLEYEKAVDSLRTAREGLIEHRATKKMKFEDEWLRELVLIEKLIQRIETIHLG
jgi:hypothetical protein